MAQQKLCEAVAGVEARCWEKRNSDVALHEINQEFELELRSRLFQENDARDSQEIEELRRMLLRTNRWSKTSKN